MARARGVVGTPGVYEREGVCGRDGVCAREGVCARDGADLDGGRKVGSGGWEEGSGGREEDCVVDTEDVTGDHGREEAIEVREKLRLNIPPMEGISPYVPAADGERLGGVPFTVDDRSSESTFVELFQRCLGGAVVAVRDLESSFVPRGDESGVTLTLYLWLGRSGVVGVGVTPERNPPNIDVRWRRIF